MTEAAVFAKTALERREAERRKCVKARGKQVGAKHYRDMKTQPWDIVDEWPIDQQVGAYRHSALKYLMRMGSKGDTLEDVKKAAHYLEKMVEVLEGTEVQEEMIFKSPTKRVWLPEGIDVSEAEKLLGKKLTPAEEAHWSQGFVAFGGGSEPDDYYRKKEELNERVTRDIRRRQE